MANTNTDQMIHGGEVGRTETSIEHAVRCASVAATNIGLPLTVVRNENTCGWWFVNSLSSHVAKSEVFVTSLPVNYFS